MTNRQQFEGTLIKWNLQFPLDREYRKAGGIILGSKEHREINQVDLYFQYLEDNIYNELYDSIKTEVDCEKAFKEGKWLKEEKDVEGEEADDLFAKLRVNNIDSNIKIED